jgi:filamentous hemagglutinin family protein
MNSVTAKTARICALAAIVLALSTQRSTAQLPDAQKGVGSTGAQVLQMVTGSRAAALSGAYTAAQNDADVIFYNPAGAASLSGGASLSYGKFVQDIALMSASGAFRLGVVTLALGGSFLNEGTIVETVPDPNFGGQRGIATGKTVSSSESAVRVALGAPLASGRARVGVAAGFASTTLAGATRTAPLFDAGAQVSVTSALSIGASLRNIGGRLSGTTSESSAPLPSEARVGAALQTATASGVGVQISADFIERLHEKTTGFAAGVEAGLMPNTARFGAVARVGYAADPGDKGLGAMRFGAGFSMAHIAVDYTYQNLDFFGATHRIGVRFATPR